MPGKRRSNDEANPRELTPDEVKDISPLYRQFAAEFGTSDANQVLLGGAHHRTREKLDDWFADCVVVAIAYDCFTTFHEEHGFAASSEDIQAWVKKNIEMEKYKDAKTVKTFKKKFKPYL